MTVASDMLSQAAAAAAMFESRWTMRALRRVDADLHDAVEEQQSLFQESLLLGEDDQIREHGEAMCRGWQAAVVRMEHEQEPDDAYQIGEHGGTTVAIAQQRSASMRVRDLHGERVIFLTPDEVAAMFVGMQAVAQVKALWPGAEITKVINKYPDEPAQADFVDAASVAELSHPRAAE